MISVISYIIAVFITMGLAVFLYPIAAIFWLFEKIGKLFIIIFQLLGNLSDNMFKFTTKIISSIWKDVRNMGNNPAPIYNKTEVHQKWTCSCGTVNDGKFCFKCGKNKDSVEKEI